MKLWVANTSKQQHKFLFREHESGKVVPVQIPIGQQRQIGGDMTDTAVESIIAHHGIYGMRRAKEIRNYRGYVGLAYSIDEPVDLRTFYEREEANTEALNKASQELREETAAAIANQTSETLGTEVKRAEIEVVEKTEGTPRVASGVEVVGNGEVSKHGAPHAERSRGRR